MIKKVDMHTWSQGVGMDGEGGQARTGSAQLSFLLFSHMSCLLQCA